MTERLVCLSAALLINCIYFHLTEHNSIAFAHVQGRAMPERLCQKSEFKAVVKVNIEVANGISFLLTQIGENKRGLSHRFY